ncbi:FmdB family zinc ribbon protein [Gandjariella thermophila]|uniref:FmdB family zinc ribbon protein n=1 Tax=Gandjariella thermophila TaxID=1931992 RepID=UPI0010F5CA8F|nr:FmdB family zinc ribbon protein [Gandjariella thermophila]
MPTYQYACTACDHRFETVQSFSDPALTECPECSGRLRKLFGSVGIVFKGSGFYRTDSRASGSESNGKASTGSNGSGGSSKSDSSSSSSPSSSGGNSSSSTSSPTASSAAAS